MSSSEPSALEKAASEAAGAPIRTSILPDTQQLELLRGEDGKLSESAIHQVRTRGRPRGARNRRQKKIADYFVQKYGDPLDVLGQVMTTPLKQLVEVLREADGSADREARLMDLVDRAETQLAKLTPILVAADPKLLKETTHVLDRLADVARELQMKPGKLALDALALQIQTTRGALEYVHGKQPISIDVTGKADLVIFAPEILKQHGIDAGQLEKAIHERGLEAFDAENMRLLPEPVDAEFTEEGGQE